MSHDHSGSLEDQFSAVIAAYAQAKADGSISFREALHIAAEITHAGCELLCKIDNPLTHKEELIRSAEAAYDKYLAPLNIVGVPDSIEPYVDRLLRDQIRPSLSLAFDRLGE